MVMVVTTHHCFYEENDANTIVNTRNTMEKSNDTMKREWQLIWLINDCSFTIMLIMLDTHQWRSTHSISRLSFSRITFVLME